MTRRRVPTKLSDVLRDAVADAVPDTPLARVSAVWPEVVGVAIAAEARPAAEREGTVSVACSSAVWAQELELLAPDLIGRLNARLEGRPVRRLRFQVTAP